MYVYLCVSVALRSAAIHLTNENKQWTVLELLPQILLQMMRCIEDMAYNLTLGTYVGSVRG
jgi:hypothetical protein